MYIEIPATTEKSRNLQELLQELAGICRNVRNLLECQESGIPDVGYLRFPAKINHIF